VQIVRTPGSARAIARTLTRPLGFVPTMGALHDGHLALVDRAKLENATVVASIFVNPKQFGPHEDFERYPRAFERDFEQLAARGVDLLYAPAVERMYPPDFTASIDVGPLANVFEGARRPGHFAGVATVVAKLLHALEPTSLYLGQKDVQQTAVLRALVRDLDMATNVVVAPTLRGTDGLALSSRNVYLSPDERAAAPSIFRALTTIANAVTSGVTDPERALAAGSSLLESPLCWDYLAIVDPFTFAEVRVAERPSLVLGVALAGGTRLLDNVPVASASGVDPILTPPRPRVARTVVPARLA
jgi:pantoate--beta-alanine ligase